ncbi:MAG: enoyl-CoA hydratase/isomerase family protein [Candidatus Thorarchaeota archaeon]
MSEDLVLFDIEQAIATITINRPDRYNALNIAIKKQLMSLLKLAEEDASIRVVILTGNGEKAFISGADVTDFVGRNSETIREVVDPSRDIAQYMISMKKPVICAVNGYALGGGCELALACDIRYASSNAKLGLPEIKLGTIPGNGGTVRLSRLVGLGIAKELIFTGDLISADEALRIGLVNKVFNSVEELRLGVSELARRLAQMPGVALDFIKQSIQNAWQLPIDEHLAFELDAFCRTFDTEDKEEGVAAFLEKRTAEFKHK